MFGTGGLFRKENVYVPEGVNERESVASSIQMSH